MTAHPAISTPTSEAPSRRQLVADAALEVLAAEGARGLTHRAVDRAAGLPEGSTSNYFRTRSALLEAALHRHVELDAPPAADIPAGTLTEEQAVEIVVAAIERILDPSARLLLVARYELFLESTRRDSLHAELNHARERFVAMAGTVLRASGCGRLRPHAAQLVALLDGIMLDRLLAADSALDDDGIRDAVARFLRSC